MATIDRRTGKTHFTGMGATTSISAKGQVVIPKDVRDRLRLRAGDRLEVIEQADGVLLRRSPPEAKLSFEEAERRLRAIIRYDGPPVSIEDMNRTIEEAWIASALRSDR